MLLLPIATRAQGSRENSETKVKTSELIRKKIAAIKNRQNRGRYNIGETL